MLDFHRIQFDLTFLSVVLGSQALCAVITFAMMYPIMAMVFHMGECEKQKKAHPFAALVGVIERLIYATAIIIGNGFVIAGWMAMKVFSHVQVKPVGKMINDKEFSEFHAYVAGNALSLLFGVLSGVVGVVLIRLFCYLPLSQ